MATPLSTSIQAPVAADGSVDISMTWQGVLPVLLALMVNSNSVGAQYARRELERMAKCADLLPGALNQLAPLADSRAPDLVSITELLLRASQLTAEGEFPVGGPTSRMGKLAAQAGRQLELRVCVSAAGHYIGTCDEDDLPFSRESVEYWTTAELANAALAEGRWTQRHWC